MLLRFEFDAANKILLARLEGKITEDDALEFYDAIRKHVTTTHASTGIWDFSSVIELSVSSGFIHQLARMDSPFPGPPRPRVMVINKTYAFGLPVCMHSWPNAETRSCKSCTPWKRPSQP